jgi:hypothetical protein
LRSGSALSGIALFSGHRGDRTSVELRQNLAPYRDLTTGWLRLGKAVGRNRKNAKARRPKAAIPSLRRLIRA